MRRLKIFFAILLLCFALPIWRLTDLLAIVSPFHWPLLVALVIWFAAFITLPLKLLLPKVNNFCWPLLILGFGTLTWFFDPFSSMATTEPTFNHCGPLTYTGTLYPVSGILSEAHQDDLEARNQLCWVRKMISKVPRQFDTKIEVETYSKLMEDKLLRPEKKYRVVLPLVAILYFQINSSSLEAQGPQRIYDSLQFWINHYTEEISAREYSLWNWPHSTYIKFEYGLIERNWQDLVNSVVLE